MPTNTEILMWSTFRQWKQFENPARDDGLQLSHWERVSLPDPAGNQSLGLDPANGGQEAAAAAATTTPEYSFARYNTTTNVYSYSSDEYVSHLRDESGNWSREETDYLFGLCHKYDLRWFVIKDRWDFENYIHEGQSSSLGEAKSGESNGHADNTSKPELSNGHSSSSEAKEASAESEKPKDDTIGEVKTTSDAATPSGPFAAPAASAPATETPQAEVQGKKERTIEELKDRYYSVCRKLIRARPASDETAKQALLQSYAFDKGESCGVRM